MCKAAPLAGRQDRSGRSLHVPNRATRAGVSALFLTAIPPPESSALFAAIEAEFLSVRVAPVSDHEVSPLPLRWMLVTRVGAIRARGRRDADS
jgi:hypothetical protein